jgi:hypothetical protein
MTAIQDTALPVPDATATDTDDLTAKVRAMLGLSSADPDEPTPAAVAQYRLRETGQAWFEEYKQEQAAQAALPSPYDGLSYDEVRALPKPDVFEDELGWNQYCRALDRTMAEREQAETSERHRLMLAGLAPITDDGTWVTHLLWLAREFGARQFTAGQVRTAALTGWAAPPGRLPELDDPEFPRALGMAYAQHAHRQADGMWLAPGGVTHGTRRWAVMREASDG